MSIFYFVLPGAGVHQHERVPVLRPDGGHVLQTDLSAVLAGTASAGQGAWLVRRNRKVNFTLWLCGGRKEGNVLFNRRTQHILFTVIWRHTYGEEPFRYQEKNPLPPLHGLLFPISSKAFFI